MASEAAADEPRVLPVPPDVRALLEHHSGLDLPSVAWEAVRARAREMERVEAMARRSRLTKAHARALGRALREAR